METNKEILIIPGLKKEYRFMQVSDLHIAVAKDSDSDGAKALAEKQAKNWSPIAGYTPVMALDELCGMVNESRPDGLFVCGDAADYFTPAIAEYLVNKLSVLDTKVYYVYGNHEKAYDHQNSIDPDNYYGPLNDGNPNYRSYDLGEIIIAVINDAPKKMTAEQTDFMRGLAKTGKPIILLIHIPLITEADEEPIKRAWGSAYPYFMLGIEEDCESTHEFCDYIKSPESNVAAIFAGHIHFPHVGEFAPGRNQYCSAPLFTKFIREITIKGE